MTVAKRLDFEDLDSVPRHQESQGPASSTHACLADFSAVVKGREETCRIRLVMSTTTNLLVKAFVRRQYLQPKSRAAYAPSAWECHLRASGAYLWVNV